jgi:hypothetical protein
VAEFVGADRALKRLGLSTLSEVQLIAPNGLQPGANKVSVTATVRDALSQLLAAGGTPLTVVDEQDHVAGLVTLDLLGGLLANGSLPVRGSAEHGWRDRRHTEATVADGGSGKSEPIEPRP